MLVQSKRNELELERFHSINIPSEWEQSENMGKLKTIPNIKRFHSINIPSEWEFVTIKAFPRTCLTICFHSINIPSEWEYS